MKRKPDPVRSAVMKKAWEEWRYAKSKGWHLHKTDPVSFADCLRLAWSDVKGRRLLKAA